MSKGKPTSQKFSGLLDGMQQNQCLDRSQLFFLLLECLCHKFHIPWMCVQAIWFFLLNYFKMKKMSQVNVSLISFKTWPCKHFVFDCDLSRVLGFFVIGDNSSAAQGNDLQTGFTSFISCPIKHIFQTTIFSTHLDIFLSLILRSPSQRCSLDP